MYRSVGIDVAFWEDSGKGKSVVAVNEVVMYIVNLCGELIEVGDGDKLYKL